MSHGDPSPGQDAVPTSDQLPAAMRRIRAVVLGSWLLAGISLVVPFLLRQIWGWSLAIVGLTAFALAAEILDSHVFFTGLSFAGIVGLTIVGVLSGLGTGWLLIAIACGLIAWDLSHFHQRLAEAGHLKEQSGLPRRHLVRLLLAVGAGTALGAAALIIRLRYGYWILLLLAAITMVGLSLAVSYLRQASD